MPYNSETETFYQAPATVVDSTPDGDTVQEGFDDRLTPAMAGLYDDLNLLKADGMISVGIPATTTARGIGRVATSDDLVDGATINNGPAFLAAGSAAVTTTPTPNAVPQADANGKLDGWVSLAGKANLDMDNLTQVGKSAIAHYGMPSPRTINVTAGAWLLANADGLACSAAAASTGALVAIEVSTTSGGGNVIYGSGARTDFPLMSLFVPKGMYYRIRGNDYARFIFLEGAE